MSGISQRPIQAGSSEGCDIKEKKDVDEIEWETQVSLIKT